MVALFLAPFLAALGFAYVANGAHIALGSSAALTWRAEYGVDAPNGGTLHLAVSLPAAATWFAFGVLPANDTAVDDTSASWDAWPPGSDVILAGFVPKLAPVVIDAFVDDGGDVARDSGRVDAALVGHVEEASERLLRVRRTMSPLCLPDAEKDDVGQDADIPLGTARVFWAWGTAEGGADVLSPHTIRPANAKDMGAPTLLLRTGVPPVADPTRLPLVPVEAAAEWDHVDMLQTSMTVSVGQGMDDDDPMTSKGHSSAYQCTILSLPAGRRHHMVAFEPLVVPQVHHVILTACPPWLPKDVVGYTAPCAAPPPAGVSLNPFRACLGGPQFAGWARGDDVHILPEDIGMPFGEHDDGGVVLVVMEVHVEHMLDYDLDVEPVGMRVHFTDELRPHEMGIFTSILASNSIVVPPGQERYGVRLVCSSRCTSRFPRTGVTVFGVGLHAHEHAHALSVLVVRKEQLVAEIVQDPHHFRATAENHRLPERVQVLPGDSVVVTAEFSSPRDRWLRAGLSATSEMLVADLHHYPRVFADADVVDRFHPVWNALGGCTVETWFGDGHGSALFIDAFADDAARRGVSRDVIDELEEAARALPSVELETIPSVLGIAGDYGRIAMLWDKVTARSNASSKCFDRDHFITEKKTGAWLSAVEEDSEADTCQRECGVSSCGILPMGQILSSPGDVHHQRDERASDAPVSTLSSGAATYGAVIWLLSSSLGLVALKLRSRAKVISDGPQI